MPLDIKIDPISDGSVVKLLKDHLVDMYRESPPESVHALDVNQLKHPSLTFWSAWENNEIVGCIALKEHSFTEAEIKSMRTTEHARDKGVASKLLTRLITEAKARNYQVIRLETGSMDFFLPSRRLYEKHGFKNLFIICRCAYTAIYETEVPK